MPVPRETVVLRVEGLPKEASQSWLRTQGEIFGPVVYCRLARSEVQVEGLICYSTSDEAQVAIDAIDGNSLNGHTVSCWPCDEEAVLDWYDYLEKKEGVVKPPELPFLRPMVKTAQKEASKPPPAVSAPPPPPGPPPPGPQQPSPHLPTPTEQPHPQPPQQPPLPPQPPPQHPELPPPGQSSQPPLPLSPPPPTTPLQPQQPRSTPHFDPNADSPPQSLSSPPPTVPRSEYPFPPPVGFLRQRTPPQEPPSTSVTPIVTPPPSVRVPQPPHSITRDVHIASDQYVHPPKRRRDSGPEGERWGLSKSPPPPSSPSPTARETPPQNNNVPSGPVTVRVERAFGELIGMKIDRHLRIIEIDPGSPADRSGVAVGYRIVQAGGTGVRDKRQLANIFEAHPLRVNLTLVPPQDGPPPGNRAV